MLKGDTNPWRTFGTQGALYDPFAPLEDPSSKAFEDALLEEKERMKTCLHKQKFALKSWNALFEKYVGGALPTSSAYAQTTLLWGVHQIKIQNTFGHRLNVWIDDVLLFEDLTHFSHDPESSQLLTIDDVGHGAESFELNVYTLDTKQGKLHHCFKKYPIGPSAFFHDATKVYYQNVENALGYPAILCADKIDGTKERVVYENKDKRFQVELLKPAKQADLFVKITNALSQRIGRVQHEIDWLTPDVDTDGKGISWMPLRADLLFSNSYCLFNKKRIAYPDKTFFKACVLGSTNDALVVTLQKGVCRLFRLDLLSATFELLYDGKTPQTIQIYESTIPTATVSTPNEPNRLYEVAESTLRLFQTFPEPLKLPYKSAGFATSKDGTRVPYTFVSHVKRPQKLVVEGYGAYGICANPSYPIHWLPYLAKGYAFALAMPRGGRDNGDAWYDGARTALRKHHTFEDTAAVISEVQKKHRISAKKTFFYGRSAGGMLAAAIGLQYPEKIGAIYAEVPYLDVLRTSSNPDLPLTQFEYDEFGDPIKRPEEFKALQRISPIDRLTLAPPKAPFFLLRSALHDVQVLPYEVLKFAKKARGLGWNAVVGIDTDGGHFAAKNVMFQQQAEDAVLLDACLKSRSASKHQTRKLRSHTPRSKTLRRKSS